MAATSNKVRRRDARDLVSVFHTSDPKALYDSLAEYTISTEQSWAKLAEMMGNPKAAADIRRQEIIRKRLEELRGR